MGLLISVTFSTGYQQLVPFEKFDDLCFKVCGGVGFLNKAESAVTYYLLGLISKGIAGRENNFRAFVDFYHF